MPALGRFILREVLVNLCKTTSTDGHDNQAAHERNPYSGIDVET